MSFFQFVKLENFLDRERISASLDTCLLTDDELAEGEDAWSRYADPFPEWTPPEVDDAPVRLDEGLRLGETQTLVLRS